VGESGQAGRYFVPAEIISIKEIKPTTGKALLFVNQWRIIFDTKGKTVVDDPRNLWDKLMNDKLEPLFAPTDLMPVRKLSTTRKTGDEGNLGNSCLETDLLAAGLLTVRKKVSVNGGDFSG